MRKRITRFAFALVMAAGSVPTLGANAASAAPPGLLETLEANPGSVRTSPNTVLLDTGLLVTFPNGEVGTEATNQCPVGFTCVWWDSNFGGPMAGIREGTAVWLRDYYYSASARVTIFSPYTNPGAGWVNFNTKVSSLYNHTYTTTAGFHAGFQIPGGWSVTYGPGAQVSYVGGYWNDSFDKACICNP